MSIYQHVDKTNVNSVFYEANDVLPAIRLAKTGERVRYYEGALSFETSGAPLDGQQKALLFLAGEMYKLCEAGEVHLVQVKKGMRNYIYYAVKASNDWKHTKAYKFWVETREQKKDAHAGRKKAKPSRLMIRPVMGRPVDTYKKSAIMASGTA